MGAHEPEEPHLKCMEVEVDFSRVGQCQQGPNAGLISLGFVSCSYFKMFHQRNVILNSVMPMSGSRFRVYMNLVEDHDVTMSNSGVDKQKQFIPTSES